MSVGFSLSKIDLDNTLGREVGAVWSALEAIRNRNLWLNDSAHNQAFMVALGYSTSEDTTMRSALGDLDSLRKLSHATTGGLGVAAVGSTAALNDFFFNAKLLGGVNWYG